MHLLRRALPLLTILACALVARAADQAASVLPPYLKISAALAGDDLARARSAAQDLAAVTDPRTDPGIGDPATALAKAKDLAAARDQFKRLSVPVVALARKSKAYFILTCPMAQADWVQTTRKVANPYFGSAMLTCGTVTDEPAP